MTDVLSGLESLFLHLETPRTPMHAASIAVFEGGQLVDDDGLLRIEELRAGIDERLDLLPRLRQRVHRAPLHLFPPVWEDDPHFDIAFHVNHLALPRPGDEDQLLELCAELLSWPLDLTRPPWEIWFVEGLAEGKVAVFEKFHHSLSDGIGGVQLAAVLLDVRPDVPAGTSAHTWRPTPPRHTGEVVAHDLASRGAAVAHVLAAAGEQLRHPGAVLGELASAAEGIYSLLGSQTIAPRTSVNAPVGRHRRLAVVRQSMDALRGAGAQAGATVNDVLLTAVAAGVRRLLQHRGQSLKELQVMVPVGLEHEAGAELANRVSAMLVRLPLDIEDPVELLGAVAGVVGRAKTDHQSSAGRLLIAALDLAPEPVIGAAGLLVQHQPFVNLVVTNVPGSPVPLYAMGTRLLEAVPIVPIAGNLSVGVAALSYEDRLVVGITADRDRCPDVGVLAGGIEDAFAALIDAASAGVPAAGTRAEKPVATKRAKTAVTEKAAPRAKTPAA